MKKVLIMMLTVIGLLKATTEAVDTNSRVEWFSQEEAARIAELAYGDPIIKQKLIVKCAIPPEGSLEDLKKFLMAPVKGFEFWDYGILRRMGSVFKSHHKEIGSQLEGLASKIATRRYVCA